MHQQQTHKIRKEVIEVKETYVAPEMEVVEFACEDVITTSILTDDNELPLL